MYNFVQMNVHISIGFCHVHLCTNDYLYYFRFSSCKYLYKWLSILFLIFLCTSVYEWLYRAFCHAHLCTNDYFVPNFFPMRFYKTWIFLCFLAYFSGINRWGRAPWCISFHDELFGVFSSNVLVSPSAQHSPTCE